MKLSLPIFYNVCPIFEIYINISFQQQLKDTLYDGRRKTCCSDLENNVFALHNKVGDGECCKSVLYNRQDHLCCNGIVHVSFFHISLT